MTLVRDTLFQDPFFSSSKSFDDFKKEMMRESRDLIMHIKEQFEIFQVGDMEEGSKTMIEKTELREGFKLEKEKKKEFRSIDGPIETIVSDKSEKRGVLPITYESGNEVVKMESKVPSNSLEDNQVIKINNDVTNFQVILDIRHYKPEEVQVKIQSDGMLCIEGKHEEKSEDGKKMISRQFVRQYTLPKGCLRYKLRSHWSPDGVLVVTAPKEKKAEYAILTEKGVTKRVAFSTPN